MAPLVKCLLYKPEDLCSDPQCPGKKGTVELAPDYPYPGIVVETLRSTGFTGWSDQLKTGYKTKQEMIDNVI